MNINIATIGETKMTLVRPLGFLPTNTLSHMAGSTVVNSMDKKVKVE